MRGNGQNLFLRSASGNKVRRNRTLAHHQNAIATPQKLGQLGAHHQNALALGSKLLDDSVNVFLSSDVDAASWVV